MEQWKNHIRSVIFDNKLYRASGDGFQQLFYNLMQQAHDNFVPIENQGSIGDRKCDGYLSGDGVFFQVYGPKDTTPTENAQKTAISKMKNDFKGLKQKVQEGFWEEIKSYILVFNDRRGSYPELIETKKELEKNNPTVTFDIHNTTFLLSKFNSLSLEKKNNVDLQYILTPDFSFIKFEILGEIVEYLNGICSDNSNGSRITVPDFNKKIKFNNLDGQYGAHLIAASYQLAKLDEFLESYHEPDIANTLCDIFKTLYNQAVTEYPDNSILQFKFILEACRRPNTPIEQIKTIESHCYVIMAKYFETCDIFKEPPEDYD